MLLKEYICTTSECPENTGHYPTSHRVIERYVSLNENPVCDVCAGKLKQLLSATPGYVKNTTNPTKCK